MKQLAFINGSTLCKIRRGKGVSVEFLSRKSQIPETKITLWESCCENDFPTIKQGEKLADILQVPFAGLYLTPNNVPEKALPTITNMRRFSAPHDEDDSSLNLAIDWLAALREEAIDIDQELGRDIPEVDIPALSSNPSVAACQLREWLSFDESQREDCSSSRKLYLLIEKKLEERCVFLAQYENVELELARGVSIYFDTFPIIGVNSVDHWPAKSFSAIHELCHLSKRASAICNQMSPDNFDAEEVYCNAVAGEFLVPAASLERVVEGRDNLLDEKFIAKLVKRFSVSRDVIARRLYNMGHITKNEYEQKLSIYDEEARAEREHQKAQRAAGIESFAMQPAYRLAADKYGSTFCETVLRAVEHGIYSEHDASKRLGISIDKLGLVFKEAML